MRVRAAVYCLAASQTPLNTRRGTSVMKRYAWTLAFLIALLCFVDTVRAQTTKGAVAFEEHCASCHGNPASAKPAPDVLSLWKLTAEELYAAMGKAPHTTLTGVSDADWREVA